MATELTLTDSQNCTLSVAFTDKKGQPALVDGAPEWLTDNPDVVNLTPAADGLSCVVAAVGPLGAALVSLKADADLGEGTQPISGSLPITVVGGAAVNVEIAAGTPTEQ